MEVDVAIVGAGGAGLSLLIALDRLPGGRRPSIALVDPVHRRAADRTWCFWDGGASAVEPAVHRAWTRAEVVDTGGTARILDLTPLRYVMVRSIDFYALADAAAGRLEVVRVPAAAQEVLDGERCAVVRAGAVELRARWVFDSRPGPPHRPANTALLQHFHGWKVRFPADRVDPALPVLMDFSVPQPGHGVAFGYVLPTDARTALIEYTEFSARRLERAAYEAALTGYLQHRWASAPGQVELEHAEDGAIAMTDAVHARRIGRRVFRIGSAGGATRASTGYTFAAMQRQACGIADALLADRVPEPPSPYPARHRWMDAVLLRALDRGRVAGPELFVRLFEQHPPERVLRFLDGATSRLEDLAVMRTAPRGPMVRSAIGDATARFGRRVRAHGRI